MENNKNLIKVLLVLIVIVGVLGYFGFGGKKQVSNTTAVYLNTDLGLEFTYPTGPNGYVLGEADASESSGGNIKTIILMQTKDKKSIDKNGASVGGEGPILITINVFSNPDGKQAGVWAIENPTLSNIGQRTTEPRGEVVGGENAVRFYMGGLYTSDNIIVSNRANVYIINGMYIDSESQIKKDFSPIVSSIKFTAPVSPSISNTQ